MGVVIYPPAQIVRTILTWFATTVIWPRAEELDKTSGGFQISRNQYDMIKSLMRQGAVPRHGKIDATLGPAKLHAGACLHSRHGESRARKFTSPPTSTIPSGAPMTTLRLRRHDGSRDRAAKIDCGKEDCSHPN